MSEEIKKESVKKESKPSNNSKEEIAIVRIRGGIGITKTIKDTLLLLKLYKKNTCVIIPKTPKFLGMLKKVKDYVTYGIIDEKTKKELQSKRAIKDSEGKDKPFFRLSPPKKGYGRKGIKKPFNMGGALGDRKEKINDLIIRML